MDAHRRFISGGKHEHGSGPSGVGARADRNRGLFLVLLSILAVTVLLDAAASDLTWTEDDWSQGNYESVQGLDPVVHPGLLIPAQHLDDIRYLASPVDFQGLYSMVVFRDTLFIASSDYPYVYDGAKVLAYDFLTNNFEVVYEPSESGLHMIKRFGDSLYLPGPDSMDPWWTEGSIYLYTGSQWIEKATLPTAVHVNDIEIVDDVTYASTGHWTGDLTGAGCVWRSYDYGDTFERVFTIWADQTHPVRRIFGLGSFNGRLFVQPDGFPPQDEVIYATLDGTAWDTIPIPGLPEDKHAMFTTWGDSLLMTIHNRMFIYNGEDWIGHWLPFDGYRWCRGIHKYKGALYGGGLDCVLYRWITRNQWETLGSLGLNPESEEIESIVTYYGRLYISTSRTEATDVGRLYVTASESYGRLLSQPHDFGTATAHGVLDWQAFENLGGNQVRFQIRSGETLAQMTASAFYGPDGTMGSFYHQPGTALPSLHHGHRYFQYAADLLCPEGLYMPFLDAVSLAVDSLDVSAAGEPETTPAASSSTPAARVRLATPHPNPVRSGGTVTLRVAGDRPQGEVTLQVMDAEGRLVRRAALALDAAGSASWRWDLRDERGMRVPTGVYRVRAVRSDGTAQAVARPVVVLP